MRQRHPARPVPSGHESAPDRRPARASAWVRMAAWAVPLCVLPSAVWRLALALGAFGDEAPPLGDSLAERVYVPGLSFLSMGLAALTLGLVQRWGERLPTWIPWIGGRRVPVAMAFVPAVTGSIALIGLCLYAVLNARFHFVTHVRPLIGEDRDGPGITGVAEQLGILAYSPLVLWGPLLLVVALSYRRRRTAPSTPAR